MDIQSVLKDWQYKVLVSCMTYNQSLYIEEALNGFAMQQTNFPYVCLVMDDASTDGEQDVIKAFLDRECIMSLSQQYENDEAYITIVPHHSNQNCTFAVYFLKKNLYGNPRKRALVDEWRDICKYEALCEGDDYWTDSQKLARQVEYMEANPDCSMVTENGIWMNVKTGEKHLFSNEVECDVSFDDLLIQRRFPTASVLYRTAFSKEFSKLLPPVFDTLLWCCLSHCGRIHYLPVASSVYRRGCGVTESDRIRWAYMVEKFNKSLNRNFDVPDYIKKIRNEDVQNNLYIGFVDAFKRGCYLDFIKLFANCFVINPRFVLSKIKRRFS